MHLLSEHFFCQRRKQTFCEHVLANNVIVPLVNEKLRCTRNT